MSSNISSDEERSIQSLFSKAYEFFNDNPVGIALKDQFFAKVGSRDISPDEERGISNYWSNAQQAFNQWKQSNKSRDISPSAEEEREVAAANLVLASLLLKNKDKLIPAVTGSRDISPEDNQRWIQAALVGAQVGYKIYKENPGLASAAKKLWKSIW
jgi:hypothetical protein